MYNINPKIRVIMLPPIKKSNKIYNFMVSRIELFRSLIIDTNLSVTNN